jgi:hypothetical protein
MMSVETDRNYTPPITPGFDGEKKQQLVPTVILDSALSPLEAKKEGKRRVKEIMDEYKVEGDFLVLMYDGLNGISRFCQGRGHFKSYEKLGSNEIGGFVSSFDQFSQEITNDTDNHLNYMDLGLYKANLVHGEMANAFVILPSEYSQKETKKVTEKLFENLQNICTYSNGKRN